MWYRAGLDCRRQMRAAVGYRAEPAKTLSRRRLFLLADAARQAGRGRERKERRVMAKPGRPRVIDEKVRDLLIGLVGMGCSRKQAARHVGIGPSTLFKELRADEDFAARLRQAEMKQDISPLRKILEHSQQSWRAA